MHKYTLYMYIYITQRSMERFIYQRCFVEFIRIQLLKRIRKMIAKRNSLHYIRPRKTQCRKCVDSKKNLTQILCIAWNFLPKAVARYSVENVILRSTRYFFGDSNVKQFLGRREKIKLNFFSEFENNVIKKFTNCEY